MHYKIIFFACCVFITRSVIASEDALHKSNGFAYLERLGFTRVNDEYSLERNVNFAVHLGISLGQLGLARKVARTLDFSHIENIKGGPHVCSHEFRFSRECIKSCPRAEDYECYSGEFAAIPHASLIAVRSYGTIGASISIPHVSGVAQIPANTDYFALMAQAVAKKNQTASQK